MPNTAYARLDETHVPVDQLPPVDPVGNGSKQAAAANPLSAAPASNDHSAWPSDCKEIYAMAKSLDNDYKQIKESAKSKAAMTSFIEKLKHEIDAALIPSVVSDKKSDAKAAAVQHIKSTVMNHAPASAKASDNEQIKAIATKLNDESHKHAYTRLVCFLYIEICLKYNIALPNEFNLIDIPEYYAGKIQNFRTKYPHLVKHNKFMAQLDAKQTKVGAGPVALPEKCQQLLDQLNELADLHSELKKLKQRDPKFVKLILNVTEAIKKENNDDASVRAGLIIIMNAFNDKIPMKGNIFNKVRRTPDETIAYLNEKQNKKYFPRLLGKLLFCHAVNLKSHAAHLEKIQIPDLKDDAKFSARYSNLSDLFKKKFNKPAEVAYKTL